METNEELKKPVNRKPIIITAAIAAVVCIVIVAVIFARGGSTEKRLAEQLGLAERYLAELDYESAIAAYEAAIEIDPKCEEAYLGLADIYIEQEKYEEAVEILEAGLAHIDSENIRSKLEEIEELLAEREKAAEELLTAAEETPVEEEVPAEEAAGRVPYADEMAAIANASVGDIVYLGSYEQDNNLGNGTEPVEWYVLDKADGEATLLAVYLLDCQPYHEVLEDITWEDCTLRNWLNDTFYNTTFSEEEQAAVVNTNVVNEDNPFFGTEGGNDTADKVWLLSFGEIERYFHIDPNVYWNDIDPNVYWNDYFYSNMSREEYAIYCYGQDNRVCAKPTAYAVERGVLGYSEENVSYCLDEYGIDMSYAVDCAFWHLRSPGGCGGSAACVSHDGCVFGIRIPGGGIDGYGVNSELCVRPAIKVAY